MRDITMLTTKRWRLVSLPQPRVKARCRIGRIKLLIVDQSRRQSNDLLLCSGDRGVRARPSQEEGWRVLDGQTLI